MPVPADDKTAGEGAVSQAQSDTAGTKTAGPNTAGLNTAGPNAAGPNTAGTDVADLDVADLDVADTAAASALARAREVARVKGFRPGSKPLRTRQGQRGRHQGGAGRDGRDPSLIGEQMDSLLLERGWNVDVAIGAVMGRWPLIVGADVADHSTPVTFQDGVLIVRTDSTAWATQLRLLSSSILGRLETEVGKDTVTELRVQGPSAPSWSHGPRKSTGPGPRDTYG